MKTTFLILFAILALSFKVSQADGFSFSTHNQSLGATNSDGTPSSIMLDLAYGRWGQQRGYVDPEGAGVLTEFVYGFRRGLSRLGLLFADITNNPATRYRIESRGRERYHWNTSKRKSGAENTFNVIGYIVGLSLPATVWFIPFFSKRLLSIFRQLRSRAADKLYIAKSRAERSEKVVIGAGIPIMLLFIFWGIMTIVDNNAGYKEWGWDFHPANIDDSWWGWGLYLIITMSFLIFWFRSDKAREQARRGGNSHSNETASVTMSRADLLHTNSHVQKHYHSTTDEVCADNVNSTDNSVQCPHCRNLIRISEINIGENKCPHCSQVFEAEF